MFDSFEIPPMPDLPPAAILITAPVGAGKTAAAIEEIIQARQLSAFGTIWVLLANRQQIQAFRERLLVASPDAVQFGVEFFDFDDLYARVLDLLGHPQRQIEDTARYQVLRHVVQDLLARGELEFFHEIAHYPGFIGLLAGLIHELKQGLVRLEDFARVTEQRGPKDRDLYRIYHAYQMFLLHNTLVDRHGAGWLAIDFLGQGAQLPPVDLLVVDGFDQFNRVQIELLTALAQQIQRTVLTLTQAPAAPGRRLHRFENTLDRVLRLGRATGADTYLWRIEALQPPPFAPPRGRAAALDHLVETIFLGQVEPVPADGALHLIEAPDPVREVGMVLRCIKRQLLAGVPPESIAIIARGIDRYSGLLRETAHAYAVPLLVQSGTPLRGSPVVALILALLDLAALDFPRREVLDVLRSPYLAPPDLTPEQITQLERVSGEWQVQRGREAWLAALDDAARPDVDRTGEDQDADDWHAYDPAEIDALAVGLRALFDRITPPPRATVYGYARWIEALIGPDPEMRVLAAAENEAETVLDPPAHFGVIAGIRAIDDADRVTRDITALKVLQRVLRGIRAAHDLLAVENELGVIDWPDFRAELQLAVDRANVTPPGGTSRAGRVIATDVLNARGLPHDHVVIMGLAEGIFPALDVNIALYQEGERAELEAAGIDMLTALERADDMSLFYQAIGLARETLTLSRFTVDDRGAPLPESPYWRAVRAVVAVSAAEIERSGVGGVPTLTEAATLTEAVVAVAAALSGEHDDQPAANVHNALLDHPTWAARWRNVLHGRALEAQRTDPAVPFDRYGGVLADAALIAAAAHRLGPDHVWSASQFNDYGICPFRFFARRLLKLEELEEPQEGLDQLQLGSINHAILEHAYRELAAEGLAIIPDNRDRALDLLDEAAALVFATAPCRYGFRPSPVWEHEQAEMLRRLRWLVELDFSAEHPFQLVGRQRADNRPVAALIDGRTRIPYRQEAVFGGDDLPLVLTGAAGPVRVRGVIDRLDRAGEHVVVMDYKSGSTPRRVEDMRTGRDFQMTLYLVAARELLRQIDPGRAVVGGLFWHVRNRQTSGEIAADDGTVAESLAYLHQHVRDARRGYFPVVPGKLQGGKCAAYCEFTALCRLNRANLSKPRPTELVRE